MRRRNRHCYRRSIRGSGGLGRASSRWLGRCGASDNSDEVLERPVMPYEDLTHARGQRTENAGSRAAK